MSNRTDVWMGRIGVAFVLGLLAVPLPADPPAQQIRHSGERYMAPLALKSWQGLIKETGRPNFKEVRRRRERQRLRALLESDSVAAGLRSDLQGELESLRLEDSDRVLVILVEFGGTDHFTWSPGDTWDPYGRADASEWAGSIGDCSRIITEQQEFTYSGPLHNQIPRPTSAGFVSGEQIWTPDFSPSWYEEMLFGDGVLIDYHRNDGSHVYEDFRGLSARDYYEDMSGGAYTFTGDVFGWLSLPHSVWWYGADTCPGRNSGGGSSAGGIPGAGDTKSLVTDALDALKAAHPDLDWTRYDTDNDGIIDRLWIVHAGLGQSDYDSLLNATDYGEATIWAHSSSLSAPYLIDPAADISAGPYIMMPESGGIGVFAHEAGHNLGAIDLYASKGDASAGFWSLMADPWTGSPIGFQPGALDPMHLDRMDWLDPLIITDPDELYTVALGQASRFPGGTSTHRAVKIELSDQILELPVTPNGEYQWWGGKKDYLYSTMTLAGPLAIPQAGAELTLDIAWDIETGWDFLWIQVSPDEGVTWATLTNAHTTCVHDPEWIGGFHGFPEDLCAAGIGGFTGQSTGFPNWTTESFDLSPFSGTSILVRFWYMTDWYTLGAGPFLDNIRIRSGETVLFADDAESGDDNWEYRGDWNRNSGEQTIAHRYYLQWRNVGADGGYDSALGDARWLYGPSNTGLIVWYENEFYSDNEVERYLDDPPSFGPKGRMLVVDAHPQPYRWGAGEPGNLSSRGQIRDAPFSLNSCVPFNYFGTDFSGRRAVSGFYDAEGYFPGVEFIDLGFGPVWTTVAWDASVVVPAVGSYSVLGPGYDNSQPLYYRCRADGAVSRCASGFSGISNLGAGSGDPSESSLQHGWNVRISSQTPQRAVLRIWNGPDRRMPRITDANESGKIDGFDLAGLGRVFGKGIQDDGYDPDFDFDLSGLIDGADLNILARDFGLSRYASP